MNLPNKLTMIRIFSVPLLIACFYLRGITEYWNLIAAFVLVASSATDLIDGRIARATGQVTNFGKLMDPIADKLLYCSAFIMLTGIGSLPAIYTVIFIAREIIISGFRLVAAEQRIVIAADRIGKAKTFVQFIGILWMLLSNPIFRLIGIPFDRIAMAVAAVLSVWSCWNYIHGNIRSIRLF